MSDVRRASLGYGNRLWTMAETSLTDLPLADAPFAALDFEGAGAARGMSDEAVQVGIATVDGLAQAQVELFTSYIRPRQEVAWTATRVHGIDAARVEGAPFLEELWPDLRERLGGRVIVAHGAATEKRFLRRLPMHGFGTWVDTLRLARRVFPKARSHRLGDLIQAAGLEGDLAALFPGGGRKWHDALFDAAACLVLLRHLVAVASPGAETRVGDLM